MTDAIEKSRVALRAFFKIAELWRLDQQEQLALLGQTDPLQLAHWAEGKETILRRDTLERISYVLGIFQAINVLLPVREHANAWVREPNKAPIFGGKSALDRMTAGNVSDLYVVRQYLDAEVSEGQMPRRLFGALVGQIDMTLDFDTLPDEIIDQIEGRTAD